VSHTAEERLRVAIESRLLPEAMEAARDVPMLGLADMLSLTLLLHDEGDPRYERAATRWVGRLIYAHPEVGLKGAEQIARALRDLDGPSEPLARSQLGVLVRPACSEAADVVSQWGR
jgi:hypothetical protein